MVVDRYETLARSSHVEIPKIKGSRFIADAIPVESPEAADREIETIRKRHHDATHHCYAYRIGPLGDTARWSDDGEPSGTAGQPILRQIASHEISDVLVVITRYYGGTKLGTGGLARAYGRAAERVLDAGARLTKTLYAELLVTFTYDDTAPVMRLVDRFEARVVSSRYDEQTTLELQVPFSLVEAFLEAFVDDLGGRGTAVRL